MSKTPDRKKEANRRWYRANKERMLAWQKKYVADHAENTQAYQNGYRQSHAEELKRYENDRREKHNAEALARYHANAEEQRAKAREWKRKNRPRCAELKQRWNASHPEVIRAQSAQRKAARVGTVGKFTPAEIQALWERQTGKCAYFSVCRNFLQRMGHCGAHRDHIEPLIPADPSRTPGSNTIDNIQLLCATCNLKKANKDPYKFTQEHEGRLFPDLPAAKRIRV